MKFKPFIVISVAFAVVFFSSMAGYIAGVAENKKANEYDFPPLPVSEALPVLPDVQSTSKEPARAVKSFTESYVLKENDGRPAIFIKYANGDEELYSTFDSPVSLLPEKDREELKGGIVFDSISDALEYAEGFLE